MRAIILAAGMGTRLRPLTLTTPKALTVVNEKPLLERQIEYLREKGIDEIIVVTGYLKEKFEYLKEKYGVKLIFNDKYDVYNNIYTMYLVKDYLKNSYVLDADIYLNRNFFKEKMETSAYFSAYKNFKNEWKLRIGEKDNVEEIQICEKGEGYILSGVSYWAEKDAKIVVEKLNEIIQGKDFENYYWDDIIRLNVDQLNIKVEKLKEDDIYEIDSIEELELLNKNLKRGDIKICL
ncbi:sugar phosphate nucleotidyltransferase [uncultured Clostridium sp.]|uniref:sugar phosphate nucleotidyltransferase n=1 Tax=uncultured Clostridium sp. TaxID=59620 RepID=UPI0026081BC0|nr:sugar phosphate nucleotidyltransferase [uncultured Clostridium sp.]